MNPMTAISVDDDPVSSMVIKRLASSIGLDLEVFSDPFAVWNFTEKQRIDIAFVDYMMPGMDGITLIRHIRQHNPDAAIVMITSHRDEGEVKIRALEAGASDFLTKPLDPAEFNARTRNLIDLHSSHAMIRDRALLLEEEVAKATEKLTLAKNRLEKSVKEKDALLSEIFHRTNNNLQLLQSILNLRFSEYPGEAFERIHREIDERLFAMAMVHQSLYNSDDLSRVPLGEYVKDLIAQGWQSKFASEAKGTVEVDVEAVKVDYDTAQPCGTILYELLSNSLRHAKKSDGPLTVRISLKQDDGGNIALTYTDDGCGLPAGYVPGSDNKVGFTILYALGRDQLGGTIEVGKGPGFSFSLRFKEKAFKEKPL